MEAEKLISRVEQQCSLIAMLKQRADRAHEQTSEWMEKYGAANKQVEQLQDKLSKEIVQRKVIEQRFHDLSHNYEEMVKIKDDYKLAAQKTSVNIEELTSLKSDLQQMKRQYIGVEHNLEQFKRENQALEHKCSHLKSLLDSCQSAKELSDKKCSQLETQVYEQKVSLKMSTAEREKLTGDLLSVQSTMKKRVCDLMVVAIEKQQQQVICKEKLLSGKESELIEQVLVVSRMEFDLREQQNELSELKKTLLEDNSVGKLKAELKLAHSRTMILQQEYTAYKTHTSQLLQNERDLNSQLRRMLD